VECDPAQVVHIPVHLSPSSINFVIPA